MVNYCRVKIRESYVTKKAASRLGNRTPQISPANVFPCRPGGPNDYVYVFVMPTTQSMWDNLLKAMGREELLEDERFADITQLYRYNDEIEAMVSEWTQKHTKYEVMDILGQCGVPTGACLDTLEVLNDPHLRQRGMVVDVDHPHAGTFAMPACPVQLSESPVDVEPSPLLGQDNEVVYKRLLGLGEAELAELREAGDI